MPGQSGLTGMTTGFAGKHPGFGDFIGQGLEPPLRAALDRWLEAALAQAAAQCGEGWAQVWDASPGFAFWIGGQVLAESGGFALRGVLIPSRDKVGRRWPFVLVQAPGPCDPPVLAGEDGFAQVAFAAAHVALAARPETPAGLLPLLADLPEGTGVAVPPTLWAANPTLPAAALWADLAGHDHRRAAQSACYFWVEPLPGRAGAALSLTGLPGGDTLAWLLAGLPADPDPAPDPVTQDAPDARSLPDA